MVTEDEKIMNIVKILRTRIEDSDDETELILIHQAKNRDNLIIADELKFWEDNELMRVTVGIENDDRPPKTGEQKEEDQEQEEEDRFGGIGGKFTNDLLVKGLPLPTHQNEEIVLISVKLDEDYKGLKKRIELIGFTNFIRL